MTLSQWIRARHARACAKHQARMERIVMDAIATDRRQLRGPTDNHIRAYYDPQRR